MIIGKLVVGKRICCPYSFINLCMLGLNKEFIGSFHTQLRVESHHVTHFKKESRKIFQNIDTTP